MKFYDNNRELHDTRAQAVKANVKNTFTRFKNKLPFKKKDKEVIAEKDVNDRFATVEPIEDDIDDLEDLAVDEEEDEQEDWDKDQVATVSNAFNALANMKSDDNVQIVQVSAPHEDIEESKDETN